MYIRNPNREMPLQFQKDDVRYVLYALKSGESCSLIGIGSVGKSNLVRHICRDEVRRHHSTATHRLDTILPVLIDAHSVIQLQDKARADYGGLWPGYEIMISRLKRAVRRGEAVHSPLMEALDDIDEQLYSSSPLMAQSALRLVEAAVFEVLTAREGSQIAFIFDDMDELRRLPPEFFQSLRGLRDDFKGQVTYLTTSREELKKMMSDGKPHFEEQMMEAFVELFNDHTRYISPLDRDSARALLGSLKERYGYDQHEWMPQQVDEAILHELFHLSGGHAGLLRRGYKAAVELRRTQSAKALHEELLAKAGVIDECSVTLNSLSENERTVLYGLLMSQPLNNVEAEMESLARKHFILKRSDGLYDFAFPLLGEFARRNPGLLMTRVTLPE